MNWVQQEHYIGSTVHRVYLPSNIEVAVSLETVCPHYRFNTYRKFKLASNQEERGMMEGIVPRISCP